MKIQDSFLHDGVATFHWHQEQRNRCSFESFRIARELIYDYIVPRRHLYDLVTDEEVQSYSETMLVALDNKLFHSGEVKIMIIGRLGKDDPADDIANAKVFLHNLMGTIGSFGKLHLFY